MIELKAGQSLRSAILNAPPTETVISVEPSVFNETIELPARERSTPLVIQSSRISEIAPDRMVTPADAGKMPKIIPPIKAEPQRAIFTAPAARYYSFVGFEVAHDPSVDWHTPISLGDPGQKTLEEVPHSLVLDRCYIHGHKDRGSVRAVALNSAKTDILNCYISDIHSLDVDSQAICGWCGPGPFRIIGNYLEAAAENVMFGGADAAIEALTPADVEMRRNHVVKPLAWKGVWPVKNLFETKNVRRLIIDGNIFENNWQSAQVGFGILIKSNNQDGTNNWASTLDLTFTNNTIRNSTHGLNIMGIENPGKLSGVSARLKFINNLWLINGIFLQGFQGAEDVIVDHNTVLSTGSGSTMSLYSTPTKGFVFTNNVLPHTGYGVKGDSVGEGIASLSKFAPDYVFSRNLMSGPRVSPDGPMDWPAVYPPDNFYPESLDGVFTDLAGGNYRLSATSLYKGKGTDGKDLGVDWDALEAAQKGLVSAPTPSPTPIPAPSPAPAPPKYVYESRTWPSSAAARLKLLNEMGAQGWELGQAISSVCYFKKQA